MSHSHGGEQGTATGGKRLLISLGLNLTLTLAQVIGGLLSGSLSLLADAAHNGSDTAALGISYIARRISRRKADRRRTFGYQRAEVIGALINLTTLMVIALYLLGQAINRLFNPREVDGMVMLVVGAIAFVEDLISAILLYQGAKGSLNIRSAFIHMVGDTLATVGVIIGSLLILFSNIHLADPIITALIAIYIAVHGIHELRRAIRLLMDSAPESFDFDGMVEAVLAIDGVHDLHHVHLWRLDEQRTALEAHIAVVQGQDWDWDMLKQLKHRVKVVLRDQYQIEHVTLELEVDGHVDHSTELVRQE